MSEPFLVAIRCPQCGAETDFPEGAHALRCAYCGIVLRVVGAHRGGQGRFVMLPTLHARALGPLLRAFAGEQGRQLASIEWQTLLLVPYWRARGIGLRWVYYRPGGPPAAPVVAAQAARLVAERAAERAARGSATRAAERAARAIGLSPTRGGRGILRLLGSLLTGPSLLDRVDTTPSAGPFDGVGAGVPGAGTPGPAADERTLQARHFDVSFPAFTSGTVGLASLGVRPGVRPLRVLAPDALPPGARMLPLEMDDDGAMALVTERVSTQFDDVPGHAMIERKAVILGSLAAIYFPLWVATVRLDGAERCVVVDAVARSVLREADPGEPWLADLPARTPPMLAAASVGFLPLKCPECAHDLPLEASAVAHFCVRCGRAFAEAGDRLVPIAYEAVAARGAAVYLPAWRFEATLTLDGRRLGGASDLPRLLKPVGWPLPVRRADTPERPISLFVPAFQCRDLHLLDRLGAALTRLQPAVAGHPAADSIPLSPPPRAVGPAVTSADAEALARLLVVGLLPGGGPAARTRLESLEVTLGPARLVWLPVHDRGGYLQDRLTGVSLRKESLGWAPDGAGRRSSRS